MKNLIIGLVAVVALGTSVVAYTKTPEVIVGSQGARGEQGIQGIQGPVGPQGPKGERGPAGASAPRLGAVASPDVLSPYLAWGGVQLYQAKVDMTTAVSSTTCSIYSPAATSTFVFANANLSNIASTTVFEIGYDSVSPNATTSLLVTKNLTLGTRDTVVASSTGNIVLAPNTPVNFKVGGGSVAGTVAQKFVGQCSAGFRVTAY